ncbi:MAG: hypothetical protein AAB676_11655 [Verrucomicrobiota bacterium]
MSKVSARIIRTSPCASSAWNLTDAATAEREAAAMAAGARLLPKAEGVLLYHEHAPETVQRFPKAQPAWRWMLEPATKEK